MSGFVATHVIAYEKDGRMLEVLVRWEGASLLTEQEWLAHSVSDWTIEEREARGDEGMRGLGNEARSGSGSGSGSEPNPRAPLFPHPRSRSELCYCGESLNEHGRRWALRAVPPKPIERSVLLELVRRGHHDIGALSLALARQEEEVRASVASLARTGRVDWDGQRVGLSLGEGY